MPVRLGPFYVVYPIRSIHRRKYVGESAPRTTQRTGELWQRTNLCRARSIATRNRVPRQPGSFLRRYTSDSARNDTVHGSRVFLADRTARACLSDEHKREHAPKRNHRSDPYHDHPRDLRRSGSCGRNNSRPRQEPTGQINQALVTLFSVASTTEISSGFFAVVNSRSEQRPVALPVLRQGERSESVAFTPHIEHTKLVQV